MIIDWTLVVEVVKALAWPTVAAFALYLLRRPLIELVGQLARRARKVSVFEVSVETRDAARTASVLVSWRH